MKHRIKKFPSHFRHEAVEPWQLRSNTFGILLDWLKALPLANFGLFASLIGSILLGFYCISVRYFPLDDLGGLAALALVFFGPGVLLLISTSFVLALPAIMAILFQRQFNDFQINLRDLIALPFVAFALLLCTLSFSIPPSNSMTLGVLLLFFCGPVLEFQLLDKPQSWVRALFYFVTSLLSLAIVIVIYEIMGPNLNEIQKLFSTLSAITFVVIDNVIVFICLDLSRRETHKASFWHNTKKRTTLMVCWQLAFVMILLPDQLHQPGWYLDQTARLAGIASSGTTQLTVTTETCHDIFVTLYGSSETQRELKDGNKHTGTHIWPVFCDSERGHVAATLLFGLGKHWLIEIEPSATLDPRIKRRFLIPSDNIRLTGHDWPRSKEY